MYKKSILLFFGIFPILYCLIHYCNDDIYINTSNLSIYVMMYILLTYYSYI